MFKIFLLCLGLHFFADYTLQGCLAQLKCKSWWQKNYPEELYKNDWFCALYCHAVYWTLVTFAPIIYLWAFSGVALAILLVTNVFFHAAVDDLKANHRRISLLSDQFLHLLQIGVSMGVLWVTRG